jgi:hypothetical protein
MTVLEAIFAPRISHVVALRSQKQMGRVHAQSVVASVADTSAVSAAEVGNFAEVEFVTDPVGLLPEAVSTDSDASITIWPRSERPVPAVIGTTFIDVLPEHRGDGFGCDGLSAANSAAFFRTEPRGWFRPVGSLGKRLAAHTAGDKNLVFRPGISARDRTIQVVGVSLSERLAAYRARRVAILYRWCHVRIMPILTRKSIFDPATMEIIRRYGLAGLMGGGAAALAGGGNREQ